MLTHLVWIVVALLAAACDDTLVGRSTPAGPSGPSAPAGSYPILIVSGADGSPVRGATVVIEGQAYQSDDEGKVTVAAPLGAWAIDVDAAGFLPRRTTTAANQAIALWPVASQEEAEAVRSMVYARGGPASGVLMPPDSERFYVTMADPSFDRDAVLKAWFDEAQTFGGMFGLTYEFPGHFQYETNEIAVRFDQGSRAACAPVSAWGFCRDPNLNYKIFVVSATRAVDPATVRRVLASWFLGPNPLPGFMNLEAPTESLSPLEMQTIRMILQRPLKNRWPDDDRW